MTWRQELDRLRRILASHHRVLRRELGKGSPGLGWVEIASGAIGDALKDLPAATLRAEAPGGALPASVVDSGAALGPEQAGELGAKMHLHGQAMGQAREQKAMKDAATRAVEAPLKAGGGFHGAVAVAAAVGKPGAKRARHCRFCGSAEHDARNCDSPTCGDATAPRADCSVVGCRYHANVAPRAAAAEDTPPEAPPAADDEDPEPSPVQARLRRGLVVLQDETRVRAKTVAAKKLSREEKRVGEETIYPEDVELPISRAECQQMPRPCPFVSCAHHLYLDVNPETGSIKFNFPHLEVWQMKETCSLDVADRGGITLEEVGAILNLTRERIRQVEVRGLAKIKDHSGDELGLPPDHPTGWAAA